MSDFDTQKYLNLVELNEVVNIGDTPSLRLLKLLVKHHITHVVYQNMDLLRDRAEVDLTPSALLERLLVENRGGVCYETCELMLKVLLEFKFEARRVGTHCFGAFEPAGPIDNHPIIVVHLIGKMYLVDVGFGFNSFREPLEFNFNETEERSCLPFEKYRLECKDDRPYVMAMWVKDSWAQLYRFDRPLVYLDDELNLKKYRECIGFPGHLPVRDCLFKAGIATRTGRMGYTCDFYSPSLEGRRPYKKLVIDNSDTIVSEVVDYATFRQGIQRLANVFMNDDHFERP